MLVTIEDIFKKIDQLDTFLIEAGCERTSEIYIDSYFTNASAEKSKVTLTISEPNYNIRRDDNDD
jgi:hypothetical protein